MGIPFFEMKHSSKPIAIIKTGTRQLLFIKINVYADKYFSTKDGQTFEIDDEYVYMLRNKTSIYIYNHGNSKPLSLSATEEIDTKLRDVGSSQLGNLKKFVEDREDKIQALSDYQQLMEKQPNIDPRIMQEIEEMAVDLTSVKTLPKDYTSELSKPTQRFLQDFSNPDEASVNNMFSEIHHQKKAIKSFSSPLIGMGVNHGHYAIVQVGYKRLDIVPMTIHENRAYTKYGVFEYVIDNVYLLKKQQIAFFILNDSYHDGVAHPMPKGAYKKQKKMIFKKQWSLLETFNKPLSGKIAKPKKETIIKILRIERDFPPEPEEPIIDTSSVDIPELSEEEIQDVIEKQDAEISAKDIAEHPEVYDTPEVEPEVEPKVEPEPEVVALPMDNAIERPLPDVPIDDAIQLEEAQQ